MARVWIPSLMRDLVSGREVVDVPGATLGHVLEALDRVYPGIRGRLCPDGQIDPAIAVHVDGQIAQLGLLEPVGERSEVHFLPAIGGG